MAAKRFLKSNVNWAEFAERVGEAEKPNLQALKAKFDNYLRKMMALPENPPKIDWAVYKNKVTNVKLIDEFQKRYEAFTIPYPKNTLESKLDELDKQADQCIADFRKESNARIEDFEKELQRWQSMPQISEMCYEEFIELCPEYAVDAVNRPTFYPHDDPEIQLGYEPPESKKLQESAKN